MAVNYGALIGSASVVLVLLVFLLCFAYAGVGPKCLRRLVRCLCKRHRTSGKQVNTPHSNFEAVRLPEKTELTLPVPVQLAVNQQKQQKQQQQQQQLQYDLRSPAKRPLPSVPQAGALAKSAPDPGRRDTPLSPDANLSLTEDRTNNARAFLKPTALRRHNENIAVKVPRHGPPVQLKNCAQAVSRRSQQLLPGLEGRRGLSSSQLSLSTIRNSSVPIPPDCLYADTEAYVQTTRKASSSTPASRLLLPHSSIGTSLKAEIGSARAGRQQQQQQQQQQGPRSNASSSDCHDWSPPQPQRREVPAAMTHRESRLLANGQRWRRPQAEAKRQASRQPRLRLVDETPVENGVFASADDDITIFELDDGGAVQLADATGRVAANEHSTSF